MKTPIPNPSPKRGKGAKCSKCGRTLKDPFSIAVGMGPECRGALQRKGWKFPKPQFKISGGHVEFVGVTGKIVPPAINTPALPKTKKKQAHEQVESSGQDQRHG